MLRDASRGTSNPVDAMQPVFPIAGDCGNFPDARKNRRNALITHAPGFAEHRQECLCHRNSSPVPTPGVGPVGTVVGVITVVPAVAIGSVRVVVVAAAVVVRHAAASDSSRWRRPGSASEKAATCWRKPPAAWHRSTARIASWPPRHCAGPARFHAINVPRADKGIGFVAQACLPVPEACAGKNAGKNACAT